MGGTVTTDIFQGANPGLSFTLPGETWIIGFGIQVVSQQTNGVFSDQIGSALINNGNIYGYFSGVSFLGSGGAITNNAGHNIVGGGAGIFLGANGETVTNLGTVMGTGGYGVQFGFNSNDVVLNNSGEVYGLDGGVYAGSSSEGGIILNSGLIRSDFDGIRVDTAAGLSTTIDNFAAGTITGFSLAIHTISGAISLNNSGTVQGAILYQAPNANDTVRNSGKINGELFLGQGNDTFNGAGGTSGEVNGEAGNDTLIGGNSGDTLNGDSGNDTIRGGRGKDSLFGGPDADIFDFNSIKDSLPGSKRDVIQDFQRGSDTIDLEGIDAKTGVSGNQKFNWIGKSDFHDKKGELRYEDKGATVIVQGDTNGDGKADFEILVKVAALGKGDFLL
ncbi:MAG: calcium-binding protein [Methyloceanibacter sp.]|uniref:calcium-binding protein n=1 Tax=Methyloceanibacter sp. TaxID=1965321 RepID=UPI003D6CC6B9